MTFKPQALGTRTGPRAGPDRDEEREPSQLPALGSELRAPNFQGRDAVQAEPCRFAPGAIHDGGCR